MKSLSLRGAAALAPVVFAALGAGAAGAAGPAALVRGPYLQAGASTSIVVRWRTNVPTDSRVELGPAPGALAPAAQDPVPKTEHEVKLVGLAPGTKYHYAVGSSAGRLTGGDVGTHFVTAPPAGGAAPVRVWVIGDGGTPNDALAGTRAAYRKLAARRHTDVWLLLGDNAYWSGTDAQYQAALFDFFPDLLRRTVVWPTIGNHDTDQSTAPAETIPYFAIFSPPTGGEAGGVASGTERYYSFDHANVHFVCLDSMTSRLEPGSPMLTWLEADLAANARDWLVAFWHHPPYSKGSHDSDAEPQLAEIRRRVLPVLEAHGVDLVLSGHSHGYERSALIDGHHGPSSSLAPAMKKDARTGRLGDGPYLKPTRGPAAHEGAVYVVAGSASERSEGRYDHPAMIVSLARHGSVILDVDGPRLDVRFLRETGVVDDAFSIVKGESAAAPGPIFRGADEPGCTAETCARARTDVPRPRPAAQGDLVNHGCAYGGRGGAAAWTAGLLLLATGRRRRAPRAL